MNGVLLVDKPEGPTSGALCQGLARGFRGRVKVGHCGTLDPFASGLLILCLGEATKIASFLSECHKSYQATFLLGSTTDTYDITGKVRDTRPWEHVNLAAIEEALKRFRGGYEQVPPAFSAKRIAGERCYVRARQGDEVNLPPVRVEIPALNLCKQEGPLLELAVTCSKGTYIRSLAHDLGEALGCGAVVKSLRRTAQGALSDKGACPWADLAGILTDRSHLERAVEAKLLPARAVLTHYVEVGVHQPRQIQAVLQGRLLQPDWIPEVFQRVGRMTLVDREGGLLAVVERSEDQSVKYLRVFNEIAQRPTFTKRPGQDKSPEIQTNEEVKERGSPC